MKLKNSFFYTLRENVKDEDSISSNLLVRAGMIKKSSAGVYMLLPLGYKVIENIEKIIKEEMDKTGAQQLQMPALISEDVYIQSGRRANFGNSMFSLKDRFNKPFVLGPTHEELFALAAAMKIRSYKDMPFSLYQIQTKFRDEPRPRYGLIRVREFMMKDAYTFDTNEEGLDIAYKKQFDAYVNIFNRLKLDYRIVKADTGVMGGLLSEEFQAVSAIGEDVLVLCDSCDYASNLEVSKCINTKMPKEEPKQMEMMETPNAKTIEEVANFLNLDKDRFVKTLIYLIDDKPYAIMVRGNREVNETKVRKILQGNNIELAPASIVEEVTNAQVGFAGPINIKCPIIMDEEVSFMSNFIVGANKTDYHYINVNTSDFKAEYVADIRQIQENDICPICGGKIHFKHGIEVGNTFKLGTKYSKALNLEYLDANNKLNPVWMGSYGIGLGRCMAAIAEQYNDENGLIWPLSIAPYKLSIVVISTKDEAQNNLANKIYDYFTSKGIDVLLDDRDERPGVKFKDMDLIGIPYRITVGKNAINNIVEFKPRNSDEKQELNIDELFEKLDDIFAQEL